MCMRHSLIQSWTIDLKLLFRTDTHPSAQPYFLIVPNKLDSTPTRTTMHKMSRLLALPAELRNRIFAFALTSSKGLRYSQDFTSTPKDVCCSVNPRAREDATRHHFNQIKYVSRSLHTETVGVELRLNDTLHFGMQRSSKMSPAEELIAYIESLSSREQAWLRKVIVDDESPRVEKDSAETVAALVRTCNQCPSLELHYVLSNWVISESPTAAETSFFLCIGIAYASAIRQYRYPDLYQLGSPFAEMVRKYICARCMQGIH
jgi:hypothetical protein